MSSNWAKSNETSLIKNEHPNDDEHSNLSNSSNTTSSSSNTQIKRPSQQTSMMDSLYSESTTMKNLNLMSSSQDQGKN